MQTTLGADDAWSVVASGESRSQWYVDAAPFRFRRGLDQLIGGPGRRDAPPGTPRLATGHRVGFWHVVEADHQRRRLVLDAAVRAPGRVRLVVRVASNDEGSQVSSEISFMPRGLAGAAYLLADLPARALVSELAMLHLLVVLRRQEAARVAL
ncbi:MAG: DUF2867 domain-containing protein [Nocardioides sp.]